MMVTRGGAAVVLWLLLAGFALSIGDSKPAMAKSAKQRQMEQNRSTARDLRQRVKELKKKKASLEDVLNSYDQKMKSKQGEIGSLEKQLKSAQASVVQMDGERKKIEANLVSYRGTLASRMRAIYMQGDLTYLELLFGSGDFSDFVDRVFFVQTICNRDEKLISRTQDDQAKLAETIKQINLKITQIDAIRTQQRQQLDELSGLKQSKQADMEAVQSDIDLYNRETAEMEAQNKRIAEEIRSSGKSASSYKGKPWPGNFLKPVPGPIVSGFGYRHHPIFGGRRMHTGVDIGASYGTAIKAAGAGKVIRTGWFGGYGNCVIVDHGGGRSTLYGHCSVVCCNAGDLVKAGQKIAEVGSTGNSTGPHLHFEVRKNGDPVDPYGVTSL